MAKIRHNNYIDTLAQVAQVAGGHGVLHQHSEDEFLDGREITVNGKKLKHFATTSYLGLGQDLRIKRAAIDAIMRYGTQFPLSRTYISHPLYSKLEEKLNTMYGHHVLVTKNSTLGHVGAIPALIRDEDAVILDHQVHWSVQNSCQQLKLRGIPVEMLRHSDLEMLEDKVKRLRGRYQHIWYFADGVYSMYGDQAPIEEIKKLCSRYPQLHIYYDDVHGTSWIGKKGAGYVMSQYDYDLPENVVLFTTLSKTFGASGAVMVTSNKQYHERVSSFGGPLTFSAQLEPASVGAACAAADIHLSDEIYRLQAELETKIALCNKLISETSLPLIEHNACPVFYVGTGAPAIGYNFIKRLASEGIYGNMGMFPAVPVKKTGLRFTISRLNQEEDIRELVDAMEYHYPKALAEEKYTANQVRSVFGLPLQETSDVPMRISRKVRGLHVHLYNSIDEIKPELWDGVMSGHNLYDHQGLRFLESVFTRSNNAVSSQWDFRYLIVTDDKNKVVLATFFTKSLWKDDMLSTEDVSRALEKERQVNPAYMTSQVLTMGSLVSEGPHLYIDHGYPDIDDLRDILMTQMENIDADLSPQTIAIRDVPPGDTDFGKTLHQRGFVKVAMPDACIVDIKGIASPREHVARLTSRSRRHFRKDIAPHIGELNIHIVPSLEPGELQQAYRLYLNVSNKNLAINTFDLPLAFFERMNDHEGWEFIVATPKESNQIVGVMFCYKNSKRCYTPAYVGMDYTSTLSFSIYRQLLFATIRRGIELKYSKVDLGFSAAFEKRKLGAELQSTYAYIQAKDNYSMGCLEASRDAG